MIKLERTSVMNFENAIRGMRNPMKSWDKSDSYYGCDDVHCYECDVAADCSRHYYHKMYHIGENDLNLARRLAHAGSDDRKFLRQIFVSVDITAPLYWWKEYDTYKVGTVANSESTMHTITKKGFELEDFSYDRLSVAGRDLLEWNVIPFLNSRVQRFHETKDKDDWYDIIQTLPTSFNQMRTCTLNYENLVNIYHARKDHKLDEWRTLCDWILTLPYWETICL